MSQREKKKHHPQHPPVPQIKKEIKKFRVILVAVILFIVFGVGIAWFAGGTNTWLITGGVIGAVLGFIFGNQIVKGLFKK